MIQQLFNALPYYIMGVRFWFALTFERNDTVLKVNERGVDNTDPCSVGVSRSRRTDSYESRCNFTRETAIYMKLPLSTIRPVYTTYTKRGHVVGWRDWDRDMDHYVCMLLCSYKSFLRCDKKAPNIAVRSNTLNHCHECFLQGVQHFHIYMKDNTDVHIK